VIIDLRKAGIKVIMLTGDKLETAENIAISCGLFDQNTDLIKITEK
jgi:P-type E1-E2 ATPase